MGICASDICQCQRNTASKDMQALIGELSVQQLQVKKLGKLREENRRIRDSLENERLEAVLKLQLSEQRLSQLQESQDQDLKEELESSKALKRRILLRNLSNVLRKSSASSLNYYIKKWKAESVENLLMIEEDPIFDNYSKIESTYLLVNNPLMNVYSRHRSSVEKPMTYANALTLINEILDKKYESDNLDAVKNRPYKKLTDFTLEHLSRMYGLRKVTFSALCSLVPALKDMYSEGHPYGTFVCQLLQVYHPEPIPDALALYLLKARNEYIKISKNPMKDTSLLEIASLVSTFFEANKAIRAVALRHLKPRQLSTQDFLVFVICFRMIKLGQTADKLFNLFSTQETISEDEMIEGLKKILDLYVPESDVEIIKQIFRFPVNKTSFGSILNISEFYLQSRNYSVSIVEYFHCLIKAYQYMQSKDLSFVRKWFSMKTQLIKNFKEFSELMLTLDSALSEGKIKDMFEECREVNSQGIDIDCFTSIVLKYNIADYGIKMFRREFIREKAVLEKRKSEIPTEVKRSLIRHRSMMIQENLII